MSMVEGIGDEVVQVFGICLVILIFVTAWKSTAIREQPQIRAVFIVDRRSQVFANDANRTENSNVPPDPGLSPGDNESETRTGQGAENNTGNAGATPPPPPPPCNKTNASSNEINAFRLSYFSSLQQNQVPSTSTASPSPQPCPEPPPPPQDSTETQDAQHAIRVKIKYLNDDQRIVTGNLKELVGQFKRRCFHVELSSNKAVVLIFQGRVLREEESLETIGMYDNCVVHCILKTVRTHDNDHRTSPAGTNTTPADWNLGPLLLVTLVSMFALAWFSYWAYPQLFGVTSTMLLACLTTIFFMTVASFYYPQLFQSL